MRLLNLFRATSVDRSPRRKAQANSQSHAEAQTASADSHRSQTANEVATVEIVGNKILEAVIGEN